MVITDSTDGVVKLSGKERLFGKLKINLIQKSPRWLKDGLPVRLIGK